MLRFPPPTQIHFCSPVRLSHPEQVSSTTESHPARSLVRPLTPAAEQTGGSWGKWSAVRVRKSEEFLSVGYTTNTTAWPLDLLDTNTHMQSHTHKHILYPCSCVSPRTMLWFDLLGLLAVFCFAVGQFSHSSLNALDPPSSQQPIEHSNCDGVSIYTQCPQDD